jgi:hypothetical protein
MRDPNLEGEIEIEMADIAKLVADALPQPSAVPKAEEKKAPASAPSGETAAAMTAGSQKQTASAAAKGSGSKA